jgi:hypothetical protein
MIPCRYLPEETEKTHESLDSIVDAPTEILIDEQIVSCIRVESFTTLFGGWYTGLSQGAYGCLTSLHSRHF